MRIGYDHVSDKATTFLKFKNPISVKSIHTKVLDVKPKYTASLVNQVSPSQHIHLRRYLRLIYLAFQHFVYNSTLSLQTDELLFMSKIRLPIIQCIYKTNFMFNLEKLMTNIRTVQTLHHLSSELNLFHAALRRSKTFSQIYFC